MKIDEKSRETSVLRKLSRTQGARGRHPRSNELFKAEFSANTRCQVGIDATPLQKEYVIQINDT